MIYILQKSTETDLVSVLSACQKSLAEFAAISGEDVSIIFGRGVYVDENTSRPANVRIGRCWRTMSALRQGANFLSKNPQVFRQSQSTETDLVSVLFRFCYFSRAAA